MSLNPWRHCGALAFLFLVACMASGIYVYAVFDTSVAGAYDSGRALTDDVALGGRLMRGLHRYSGDACVLFTLLHIVRETIRRHFARWRAWSWLSGWVLVPLLWIAGITGFWLAWDARALFSAAATAEWLAAWPWNASALARNFATGEAMNDRFFSLAIFLHIGVALLALAAMWAHVARIARVRAWPPRTLVVGTLGALAALALLHPAASLGRADAFTIPAALSIDWFFLFPHAAMPALSPEGLWLVVAAVVLPALAAPWMDRARPAAAVVNLAQCNGCARCADDCPFGAIDMAPRSDGRRFTREAHVDAALCAGCGICVGACPTATPLRRADAFAAGIELPSPSIADLQREIDRAVETPARTVVFACAVGPQRAMHRAAAVITVPCVGMIPPSFAEYAWRRGAAHVVVEGCREDDCEYRLGDRCTRERFARAGWARVRALVHPLEVPRA